MRRLIFILILVGATIAATAQTIDDKLSPSTMMLLSEIREKSHCPKPMTAPRRAKGKPRAITTSHDPSPSRNTWTA